MTKKEKPPWAIGAVMRRCVAFSRFCEDTGFSVHDAAQFLTACRRRATAWIAGNNSGLPAVYERYCRRSDHWQARAAEIASKYGFEIQWPGLWPVLRYRPDTGEWRTVHYPEVG